MRTYLVEQKRNILEHFGTYVPTVEHKTELFQVCSRNVPINMRLKHCKQVDYANYVEHFLQLPQDFVPINSFPINCHLIRPHTEYGFEMTRFSFPVNTQQVKSFLQVCLHFG